jgi:hypothetical protein
MSLKLEDELDRLYNLERAVRAWRSAYLKFVSEEYKSENDAAFGEAEHALSIALDGMSLP